jgi:hypothetical protein
MADKAQSPTVLADSLYSKPTPKWMFAAGMILGLFLEFMAISSFWRDGLDGKAALDMFLGAVCIYGSGISRKMYLSDIGIIRETHSWGRIVRRVTPWKDVKHVSLAIRGDKMMAFFEIGLKGWKVLFSKDQEPLVRGILDEMLPDFVDVEIADKR